MDTSAQDPRPLGRYAVSTPMGEWSTPGRPATRLGPSHSHTV